MIGGISKAVALYLAPILALTATLLSLFAFLAPTLLLSDRVALVTIGPSTVLVQPGPSQNVDGPSVFLGSLGSCARPNNDASVNCALPSVSPRFDLSVLPKNAPASLLYAPSASTPVFISIALALDVTFLITFTLVSLRHKMGKAGNALETPLLQNLSAGIGFLGFMIGLTSFLILRMWFGKAVQDFNSSIQAQGSQGPKLVADTGNAFTMIWVAHAFWVVPMMIALTKYHVKSA
ncbi:hypothetical protein AN958_12120 [Leucoagaricus sp. SymC.cos]|nr:hypothetical protein AN958_12120 [Leucoagaricus sp. SymC.cos]